MKTITVVCVSADDFIQLINEIVREIQSFHKLIKQAFGQLRLTSKMN